MNRRPITCATRKDASRASLLIRGFLLCSGLTAVPAFAQDSDKSPSNQKLQEIVITAQRREQNLQDTPISVSAFTPKTLKEAGVANLPELSQVDPSLEFSGNVGVVYPFLRGVGNVSAGTPGNESSVAVYVDDVYYTRLSPAYLALGDINRVEVLNGPQGTLFGRNSSGGAIQIFTRDPSSKPEMDATFGYANYQTVSGNVYASTPITKTLSWNVAVGASNQGRGWGKDLVTGKDAYLQSYVAGRSKLLWRPSDRTSIKLIAYYDRTSGDIANASTEAPGTNVAYPNWGPVPPPGYPAVPTVVPSLSNNASTFYDTMLNYRNVSREHGYGGSVRIDQRLGFADFVSISAFRKSKGIDIFDDDYLPVNFANVHFDIIDDDISQEFQLKSKPNSKISWIVGAYYLHNKAGNVPVTLNGDLLNIALAPGAYLRYVGEQKFDSYAGFAQTTVPVADNTNVTVGLRYTWDDLRGHGTQDFVIPGFGVIPIPGARTPFDSRSRHGAFTYRVAVDHHFAQNLMGYASVSRGYKAGTFNTVPLQDPANKPEIVNAYELGLKSEFLDHRVRLNGAVFWNDIKDPQVDVFTLVNGVPGAALINAKGARTRGAELSIDALPAEGLKLRGGLSYLDARYTDFNNAPFYHVVAGALTGPTSGDATGNRMPDAPKWRFDVGANYTLETGIGQWVGDVNAAYTSRFAWTPDNLIWRKPLTLVNASLSLTPASTRRMTVTAWVKNLLGAHYVTLVQEQVFQLGSSEFQAAVGAPRTFGATVSVKLQ